MLGTSGRAESSIVLRFSTRRSESRTLPLELISPLVSFDERRPGPLRERRLRIPRRICALSTFIVPGLGLPEDAIGLAETLAPYVLRRTRRQVFGDEAPTLRRTMRLTLTPDQQVSYDRELSRVRGAGYSKGEAVSLLAAITRLKQICNYDRPSGSRR